MTVIPPDARSGGRSSISRAARRFARTSKKIVEPRLLTRLSTARQPASCAFREREGHRQQSGNGPGGQQSHARKRLHAEASLGARRGGYRSSDTGPDLHRAHLGLAAKRCRLQRDALGRAPGLDRPEMPTELTQLRTRIGRKVRSPLRPDSSRGASARMIAEFRNGDIEAAILAGRRGSRTQSAQLGRPRQAGEHPVRTPADGKKGSLWRFGPVKSRKPHSLKRKPHWPSTPTGAASTRRPLPDWKGAGRPIALVSKCSKWRYSDKWAGQTRPPRPCRSCSAHGRASSDISGRPCGAGSIAPPLVASLQAGLEKAGLQIQ